MAAEQEVFGVVTTGAETDLQSVTGIARQMVGRWGMSPTIGPVQVYPPDGDPRGAGASEGLLEAVDDEVRRLIDGCYAEARRLLREHHEQHEAIVRALMERETLDEDEAYAVAGIERTPAPPQLVGAAPGSPGHEGTDAVGATAPSRRLPRGASPAGPTAAPSPTLPSLLDAAPMWRDARPARHPRRRNSSRLSRRPDMSTTASGPEQQPPEPSTSHQAEVGGIPAGAVALKNVTTTTRPVTIRHGVSRAVFYPSAGLVLLFVLTALLFPSWLSGVITAANDVVVRSLGWYYVLIVTGFVIFALFLALSRLGDIRLGRDEEAPQYGLFSWFAMLFAAGMGIGLVFWGVAEPLNHYATPPPQVQGAPDVRAQGAMTYTFLHWGLHAWAIYIVVGLSVAYVVHRRRRPVSLRWALEPVLGTRRVQGGWGHLVDVVAVVGTIFGVATSLGFGVAQVGAGLDFLGILTLSRTTLVVLIIVIAGMAAISVATGLDAGIKWLSNINLVLAGLLLLLVLCLRPDALRAARVRPVDRLLPGQHRPAVLRDPALPGRAGREPGWRAGRRTTGAGG